VSEVIVRHDLVRGLPGRTFADPAADGPSVSSTFTTTGGRFIVSQRGRAAPVLTPREVVDVSSPSGAALELVDPAVVLVNGEVVSSRPPHRHPLDRPGLVAVTAGDRTVSLDRWLAPSMPFGSSAADGPPTVAVGPATPLVAWSQRREAAELLPFGKVYDCNNYEPRPWAELGLASEPIEGGRGVRLQARDHAACVAADVREVGPGDTVRLRLEYRSVEGKRPQICLLEVLATGRDRCVPIARLQADDDWQRVELVHTVADDAESLRVVLYANVGLRLSPAAVTEYRDVTVEALEPVLRTEAWPQPVPPVTIDLGAGEHVLEVTGGQYGSVLADFEPLDDCFRYDDRTVEEAGLEARPLPEDGGPAFELRATHHMACVGATAPDFGGTSLYEVSFDHRSLELRKPRVCWYLRGPDVCEPMSQPGSDREWTGFRRDVRVRIPTVEARLYLYGMRDLAGERQSVVQYRRVQVRPPAIPSTIVLVRAPEPMTESPVDWSRTTPASFRISAPEAPARTTVGITETFAPGWSLLGLPDGATATKVAGNGWQSAWIIEGLDGRPLDAVAVYTPAFTARKALLLSVLALPAAVSWLAFGSRVRTAVGQRVRRAVAQRVGRGISSPRDRLAGRAGRRR
jgi:arabinofuranan 3-O-arabinosyltransferase